MQFSIEDIVKSLRRVGKDVDQIVRLNSEENLLVAELLDSLKHVHQQMLSLGVSTFALPIGLGAFNKAHIDSAGHLILTSKDGRLEVMDLSETKNRDLMMAVVGNVVPKFKDLVR